MRDLLGITIRHAAIAGLALGALVAVSVGAQAGDMVKKIAVLVPEQGTDYGWNQQGVDAALVPGRRYPRRAD